MIGRRQNAPAVHERASGACSCCPSRSPQPLPCHASYYSHGGCDSTTPEMWTLVLPPNRITSASPICCIYSNRCRMSQQNLLGVGVCFDERARILPDVVHALALRRLRGAAYGSLACSCGRRTGSETDLKFIQRALVCPLQALAHFRQRTAHDLARRLRQALAGVFNISAAVLTERRE